jgi:hypothetical protein
LQKISGFPLSHFVKLDFARSIVFEVGMYF